MTLSLSFFLAITLRFWRDPGLGQIAASYDGLYFLIYVLVVAIYAAVFLLNEYSSKPLNEQNPFEMFVTVLKNQGMVFTCLVVLLYLIKRGFWASRAVVVMLAFFGVIFGCIVRLIYGRHLKKVILENKKTYKYLLLTDSEAAKRRIEMELPPGDKVVSAVTKGCLEKPDIERLSAERGSFDKILVFAGDAVKGIQYEEALRDSETLCRKPVSRVLSGDGVIFSTDMIRLAGDIPTVCHSGLMERSPVLGVYFTVTCLTEAVRYIKENISSLKGKYICFGNVHTSVMAYENDKYREIQNNAAFVMPDGSPVYREQRKKGFKHACRVAGPDFMRQVFLNAMDGSLSMYFYGSTEETLKGLRKLPDTYPGIDIRGFEAPPFRELDEDEDREVVRRINESGADILWVGLGAPKQEKWMAAHKDKVNSLMLGVGAGFDFHAGTIKRAPDWVQRIGMEWFYRLLQDPGRLLKRYLVTNTKFYIYKLLDKGQKAGNAG